MAAAITNHSRCVLLRLTDHWAPRVDKLDVVMLWPDVGCVFFGFLRAGEVTVLDSLYRPLNRRFM